jgi:hypothetical protein
VCYRATAHGHSCVSSVGRFVQRPYFGPGASAVSKSLEMYRTVSIRRVFSRLFLCNCERSTQLMDFSRPDFAERSGARIHKGSSFVADREIRRAKEMKRERERERERDRQTAIYRVSLVMPFLSLEIISLSSLYVYKFMFVCHVMLVVIIF